MASFNLGGALREASKYGCTPKTAQPDPETGCGPYCGENNTHQAAYEQCRQAFFTKQQNQILQQQQLGETKTNPELDLLKQKNAEITLELESTRQNFANLVEQYNKELAFRNAVDYGIMAAVLIIGVVILFRKFLFKPRRL